jgi:hypothetical protein
MLCPMMKVFTVGVKWGYCPVSRADVGIAIPTYFFLSFATCSMRLAMVSS